MYCFYQLSGNEKPMEKCHNCLPHEENEMCEWYLPLNIYASEKEKKRRNEKENDSLQLNGSMI